MTDVVIGVKTDKGCCRSNNEDYYLSDEKQHLYIVADGIGGHDAGEVASRIACQTIKDSVANGYQLVDAVHFAHEAILQGVDSGEGAEGMGSTVVAMRLDNNQYEIAWVGDSRAYLWDKHDLIQLSRDHSLVQQLVDQEIITPEQARRHQQRNVITQALGIKTDEELKYQARIVGEIEDGQQILLCSDGLYDELSDDTISKILASSNSVQENVNTLLQAALDEGGRDNITIMLVAPRLKPIPPLVKIKYLTQNLLHNKSSLIWLTLSVVMASALGIWLLA